MLQVGRDHVIALPDDSLDRQVQPVGAVERKDPALRSFAAKELVERVSRIVQCSLGPDCHPVPGPARVRQAGSRETIEGLVDGFGLGEAGGGVVEVDHEWRPWWAGSLGGGWRRKPGTNTKMTDEDEKGGRK